MSNKKKQIKLYRDIFNNYSTDNTLIVINKIYEESKYADNIFKELITNIFYYYLINIKDNKSILIHNLSILLKDFKKYTNNSQPTTNLKINIETDTINISNFLMLFHNTKLDKISMITFYLIEPYVQILLYKIIFNDKITNDNFVNYFTILYRKICYNMKDYFCDSLFKQFIINLFYTVAYKKNISEDVINKFYEESDKINQSIELPIRYKDREKINMLLYLFQDNSFGSFSGAYLATLTYDMLNV